MPTHAQLTGLAILHRTNDRAGWKLCDFEIKNASDTKEVLILIRYKLELVDQIKIDEYVVYSNGYYGKANDN